MAGRNDLSSMGSEEMLSKATSLGRRGYGGKGVNTQEYQEYQEMRAILSNTLEALNARAQAGVATPEEEALRLRLIKSYADWHGGWDRFEPIVMNNSEKAPSPRKSSTSNGKPASKKGAKSSEMSDEERQAMFAAHDAEKRRREQGGKAAAGVSSKRVQNASGAKGSDVDAEDVSSKRAQAASGEGGAGPASAPRTTKASAAPKPAKGSAASPSSSWFDLPKVISGYFGHGPLGDEEDRITHIIGDWYRRRRERRRSRRKTERAARRFDRGSATRDSSSYAPRQEVPRAEVSWGDDDDKPRRPTDDMLAEEKERIDRSEWVSWMDEVRIKHQMAHEGDPEAMRWVDEVYPYEAARRYEEEVLHADETAAKRARDFYRNGVEQSGEFASSVGNTVRRMGRGGGLLSLIRDWIRDDGPVKVREYEQTRNGKTVRVKSHERGRPSR